MSTTQHYVPLRNADTGIGLRRAAEYVRMSTEHQNYSTENQADAIPTYADQRGLQIVQTYADSGKSGLRIERREALQRLIHDVEKSEL